MLLLVQRVDVVYWAGHQDDQEKGAMVSYYAAGPPAEGRTCSSIHDLGTKPLQQVVVKGG